MTFNECICTHLVAIIWKTNWASLGLWFNVGPIWFKIRYWLFVTDKWLTLFQIPVLMEVVSQIMWFKSVLALFHSSGAPEINEIAEVRSSSEHLFLQHYQILRTELKIQFSVLILLKVVPAQCRPLASTWPSMTNMSGIRGFRQLSEQK